MTPASALISKIMMAKEPPAALKQDVGFGGAAEVVNLSRRCVQ
jgi:hypothetical protein